MKFHLLSNAPELDLAKISAWFLQEKKQLLVTAPRISQTYQRNGRSLRHLQSKEEQDGNCLLITTTPVDWATPWLRGEESVCNGGDTGDVGSIFVWGRFPGGGHGKPLQCSCLENPTAEEPGGLQSTQSQRVRHNWAENSDWTSLWISQSIFLKKLW